MYLNFSYLTLLKKINDFYESKVAERGEMVP